MMGYKTPNIDRIAKEGALFTDWYGQRNCTAGRACFITGQSGFRTGLLKVGLPGAKEGLQARDVTLAQLLKAQGYSTTQFGKNHLGDADDTLPTAHGFAVWQEPFVPLRLPKIINLRMDPFEVAEHVGIGYPRWRLDRTYLLVPAQQLVGQFIGTFREYPPSQKVGSFSLDDVLKTLTEAGGSGK
jgi:arylsulfatase A-like enzyme